jgi:hypothetical protein
VLEFDFCVLGGAGTRVMLNVSAETDETRERADPEGRPLQPGYAEDLVSFGRGNRGPLGHVPALRGFEG